MTIIIEVNGGTVTGVYKKGKWSKRLPDVAVVDHDLARIGGQHWPHWWTLMPLSEADEKTQKLIT